MENNKEKKVKGNAMVNERNKYIRFDWAAKYMLHSKADYVIFEGFIFVLLGERVTIDNIKDGEWNRCSVYGKYRRVVIIAYNSKGEKILIEIRQTYELDYLERLIYSEGIPNNIPPDDWNDYVKVKKVYSINILYFDLGEGADYLYHGQTSLVGVHTKDTLQLTQHEQADLHVVTPEDVFPEYFVIRVNEFDKLAVTPLDEWLQYLKDEYIKPDTTVPGLREARERLEYLKMSLEERHAYDYYLDTLVRDTDVMKTKLLEAEIQGHKKGMAEGLEEGRAKGREEGEQNKAIAVAQKMKEKGYATEDIAEMTGLSFDEVMKL